MKKEATGELVGELLFIPDKSDLPEVWAQIGTDPITGFAISVVAIDPEFSDEQLLTLFGIPDWSIDAEAVLMSWRQS